MKILYFLYFNKFIWNETLFIDLLKSKWNNKKNKLHANYTHKSNFSFYKVSQTQHQIYYALAKTMHLHCIYSNTTFYLFIIFMGQILIFFYIAPSPTLFTQIINGFSPFYFSVASYWVNPSFTHCTFFLVIYKHN